jgi:hypothetical protein
MPRPKPKFKDNVHYLQGVKYKPFDESEFFINKLLTLYCENGHKYVLSISDIKLRGKDPKYCPHCNKQKRLDENRTKIGIHRSVFEEIANKSDFTFITKGEYFVKNDFELKFKCNKCGKDKKFAVPKYVVKQNSISCGVECEKRIKRAKVEEKEKHIKKRNIVVDLHPQKFNKRLSIEKEKEFNENNWRVVEYNGSKKKGIFQCVKCGELKNTYPCNVISKYKEKRSEGYTGCKGCHSIRYKEEVERKIENEVKKNEVVCYFENYIEIDEKMKFGCKKCGEEFEYSWKEINRRYNKITCPFCHKSNKRGEQTEVYEFLKSNYKGEIKFEEVNIIKPLQLDMYIPELNLAIEYCGTIWHSTKHIENSNYHKNKLEMCEKKGIRLVTIFSDEWKSKKEICKKRLLNALGCIDEVIYARKTKLEIIDNKIALDFCNEHHIQGKGQAFKSYGLFNNNELVSVMTFSKPMVSKSANGYDYELNRFCSIINVVGGASKLFKAFVRDNPNKNIVSFCDLRWGTGNVYEKLGFEELDRTRPNYFYVGNKTNWERKHRFGFTKKTLKERYNIGIEGTEKEMAESVGLYRIFDCGHKKYMYRS